MQTNWHFTCEEYGEFCFFVFVFLFLFFNKRRKENSSRTSISLVVQGPDSCIGWKQVFPLWSPGPVQLGLGTASLGMLVLAREQDILGSECFWVLGLFS